MNNKILGMNQHAFNTMALLLLLIILGIVTFHYYAYVSGHNGFSFGTGFGVNILPGRKRVASVN